MNTNRRIAVIVGVLYIMGTVAGVLSVLVTQSILGASDYLTQIAANENQIVTGILFLLAMGFSLAMVPVMLFPVLRKHNEILALGYLIFRGALETVTYIAMAICWSFLILISREYVAEGASNTAYLQTLGTIFLKGNDSISTILVIIFALDALMLYYMLYQSKLIPRWISVWGFIAIIMHFSTAFLILYGFVESGMSAIVSLINMSIFFQEMVMAVWLIVKGFSLDAIKELDDVN
jgi:hypothetical protein